MPKTSSFDDIMQQLDALSLPELLQVKAKVNALIKVKSLTSHNTAASTTVGVAATASGVRAVSTNPKTRGFVAKIVAGVSRVKEIVWFVWGIFTSKALRDLNRDGRIEFSDLLDATEADKLNKYKNFQSAQLKVDKDDSLEKLIELVDKWMDDESGYDEETFPQIEAALNQNHPSH